MGSTARGSVVLQTPLVSEDVPADETLLLTGETSAPEAPVSAPSHRGCAAVRRGHLYQDLQPVVRQRQEIAGDGVEHPQGKQYPR